MPTPRKPATAIVAERNRELAAELPFDDERDFEDARHGFVGALAPGRVVAGRRTVWDLDSYSFLTQKCPPTANPSLWRQGRLSAISGLFEVAPGFYQLRGLDLSNMTIVEGHDGVVVIDPLISAETAAAGVALYREHRGERPVTGVVYTHSHVDHFGGVRGIVSAEDAKEGRVPILAPEGFLEHAVSENVYAGTAMARRAGYMYGTLLDAAPDSGIGAGLGLTTSTGSITLLAPTLEITETGQQETLDGVRFVFQLTPGTEAPAEMNFHFPDSRVLCVAENATHTLHNLITLRGALVRDARVWARYLDETIELFAHQSDVLFAGHHWPLRGTERITEFLAKQRDLYGYVHDQTMRLINKGLTAEEIAEDFELPPSLAREWHCRDYYGSLSHNVKGVYQRYMGWFDGNPAHLWGHPPAEAAGRYVEFMGGADAVLERARASFDAGDFRWVAEVVNHVVFADSENAEARELQAAALEQLGYGAENATWRNFYLTGAKELRDGVQRGASVPVSPDLVAQLPISQILDGMAIRVNGPRAWDKRIALNWEVTDTGESHALRLENGVLTHRPGGRGEDPDATLRFERSALDELIAETTSPPELFGSGRMTVEGDGEKLGELLALLDEPDPSFAIVTP